MPTYVVSTRVAAPAERVFEVFTDVPRAAERIPGIAKVEMLTEGPFRVGTRWRETRIVMKKQATEEMWVTTVDPPRSYTVEAESHGTHYDARFEFKPDGDGTQVTWTFRGTPLTFGAKLMSAVLGPLFKGMMKKWLAADLEALRTACEGKASAAGAGRAG